MRESNRPKVVKATEFLTRAKMVYEHALEHIDRLLQSAVADNPAAIDECLAVQASYQTTYVPAVLKPLAHPVSEQETSEPVVPEEPPRETPVQRAVEPSRVARGRR